MGIVCFLVVFQALEELSQEDKPSYLIRVTIMLNIMTEIIVDAFRKIMRKTMPPYSAEL